jgi:hypothetical protein
MKKQRKKDRRAFKAFSERARNPEKLKKQSIDYSDMSYQHIQSIFSSENPLPFWEEIVGMVSVMDGETLRYILHAKIPLEKFIRYELVMRGFDQNHKFCGYDKACEIWLK